MWNITIESQQILVGVKYHFRNCSKKSITNINITHKLFYTIVFKVYNE